MNRMNPMVMTMLFAGMAKGKARRRRMMETMLPLAIMPPGSGFSSLFTGVVVDRQLRRAERDSVSLAKEAAGAIEKALQVDEVGGKIAKGGLDDFPRLNKLLAELKLKDDIVKK